MSTSASARPDPHLYFMGIALAVRERADCMGSRVGAVIVVDKRIVSTGYNGTPANMPNCTEGGCHRCAQRAEYPSGTGYDLCICVHAEQNALLAAARFGIAVQHGTVYTTMQPCFGCTKEMLQAGVAEVYYLHSWSHPDAAEQAQYQLLQGRFPGGIRKLAMHDPRTEWAVPTRQVSASSDETGHTAS